jgi:hypothetical protein
MAALVELRVHQPRPPHHLLRDLEAGSESLQAMVAAWPPLLPTPGQLEAAQRTAEGIRKVLAELYHHLPGGGPDAA